MAEYIEREKVINNSWYSLKEECGVISVDFVKSISAADVRPVVRGKWKLNKDGTGTCSVCGRTQKNCWDMDNWDNFCHNCGADMRPTTVSVAKETMYGELEKEKSICDDCATENCLWRTPTGGLDPPVKSCDCFTAKPTTNADRIRAMSDEKLAEWLQRLKYSPSCDAKCHNDFEKYGEQRTCCKDCWLKWLRQEATP